MANLEQRIEKLESNIQICRTKIHSYNKRVQCAVCLELVSEKLIANQSSFGCTSCIFCEDIATKFPGN